VGDRQGLTVQPLLFCDPRFHDLNGVDPADRRRHETPDGVLDGVVTDGVFESGHHAPFGGPDLAAGDPPLPHVQTLLEDAVAALGDVGTIRIKARPSCYSPAEPVVQYLLLQMGFAVEHCDVNQHIDLAPFATADDYVGSLKKKRAHALRADLAGPLELREAHDDAGLAACHGVMAANRAAHGRPPGLPLDYLRRARDAFPGRIHPYVLAHDDAPVAAALVYEVLPDVDLLVAWGDHGHDLPRSPMNLLAYHLVARSIARGARVLDLGPSSEKDGSPNAGLVHFKRSVGAAAGTRLVLVRSPRP
jgi:GNAT acetyltransferase-like protein